MFLTKHININELYRNGFTVGHIDQMNADIILKEMKKESWIEVTTDEEDPSGKIDKYYASRYISAQTILQPEKVSRKKQRWMDAFNEWASTVLCKYEHSNKVHVSSFCGKTGYYMDAHTDVGDRAIFDVITYFGHDIQ